MIKQNKKFNLALSFGQLTILMSVASLVSILIEQNNQSSHNNQKIFVEAVKSVSRKDISRKSLVFDIKTPKVFYCQQEKQTDYNKIIVKAKPLEKLCEYEGFPKPKNYPSDCYNDIDETEFACDEKRRFLVSLTCNINYNLLFWIIIMLIYWLPIKKIDQIRLESPLNDFDNQQHQDNQQQQQQSIPEDKKKIIDIKKY